MSFRFATVEESLAHLCTKYKLSPEEVAKRQKEHDMKVFESELRWIDRWLADNNWTMVEDSVIKVLEILEKYPEILAVDSVYASIIEKYGLLKKTKDE